LDRRREGRRKGVLDGNKSSLDTVEEAPFFFGREGGGAPAQLFDDFSFIYSLHRSIAARTGQLQRRTMASAKGSSPWNDPAVRVPFLLFRPHHRLSLPLSPVRPVVCFLRPPSPPSSPPPDTVPRYTYTANAAVFLQSQNASCYLFPQTYPIVVIIAGCLVMSGTHCARYMLKSPEVQYVFPPCPPTLFSFPTLPPL
jgi:hypothetical protein